MRVTVLEDPFLWNEFKLLGILEYGHNLLL